MLPILFRWIRNDYGEIIRRRGEIKARVEAAKLDAKNKQKKKESEKKKKTK